MSNDTNEKKKPYTGTAALAFSARDVAEALDLPYRWVLRSAHNGTLPCLKVGAKKLIFNLDAVAARLAELAAQGNVVIEDDEDEAGEAA